MAPLSRAAPEGTRLIPALWLGPSGQIQQWSSGESGPALGEDGKPLDLFETADRLTEEYGRLYIYDLEGIRHGTAQLDYLAEISREAELWVDAGIEDAGDATDIIIAGASRAVLSTARLRSASELGRAWKLTPEIVLEIRYQNGELKAPAGDWGATPSQIAESARSLGVKDLILQFRGGPVGWDSVRQLAGGGPTWVAGELTLEETGSLEGTGASGAIFSYPPEG
ncbi:MAG: HisA/HisF-related TIM barrel protein [Thermoplasmata archaeon]|nr:HisA/HisF-related TIM barrel protein [Thermoplasmata archaeon]